ncbi:MAG: T9SS type A sorting domain-containing protein [Candidatus Kapabacteria bacterium]|nr:T9SS type A sorting domain-containing protein [Candidatus Kapabacteria bacterium]
MIMMRPLQRLLLPLCALVMLYGCASNAPTSDAALAPQDRKAYMLLRYADPATGQIPEDARQQERHHAASMPGAYGTVKAAEALQQETWMLRGPWNIGGRTRALFVDPADERLVIAAGVSGGVWRSTDNGTSWTKVTRPDQLHSVTCIAHDPRPGKDNLMFYGTGEIYGNSAGITGDGIYKSTNKGLSWEPIAATVTGQAPSQGDFAYTWRILVHPTSTDTVLFVASAENGVLRSTNAGRTWTTSLGSTSLFSEVYCVSDGTLYATLSSNTRFANQTASRRGIFRSTDVGATWQEISPSFMPATTRRIVLGIAPSDPKQIYAIAETPNAGTMGKFLLRDGERTEWHSIWKYHADRGWEDRSAALPLFGGRSGDFFSQGGYDLVCNVSPFDTNVVVVGGTNLYTTSNGFVNNSTNAWIGGYGKPSAAETFPSYPEHHPDQHDVVFSTKEPLRMYSANDGGVQMTRDVRADTVVWTSLTNGYITTQHYAIAITDLTGDARIMGGMQDNGTFSTSTFEQTQPWERRGGGDGSYCSYIQKGRGLVVSTQNARIRRVVLDSNGTEVGRGRIDPIGGTDYLFINPFAVDPVDERFLYLAGGRIMWRNNNLLEMPLGGDDSTLVNWDSLPQTRLASGQISAIAVSRNPSNVVWYGTSNGGIYKLLNASSKDATVVRVDSALPNGAYVSNIAIDPSNGDHVVFTFSNYNFRSVFATTDGGATWSDVSGNLEGPNGSGPAVNWVTILPRQDGRLYVVGTSTGLYYTAELNGTSTAWAAAAARDIGNVPIDMVVSRPQDGMIAVGTHGYGVFSGTIDEVPVRPSAPTLRTPSDAVFNVPARPEFRWTSVPNAVSYRLEIARDKVMQDMVRVVDNILADSVATIALEADFTTYHWRVTAFGVGGKSEPSDVWSFTSVVGKPTLTAPAPGAKDVPTSAAVLAWNQLRGADTYEYQLGATITISTVLKDGRGADTTATLSGLEPGKRYFWRVRGLRDGVAGEWTTARNFTTDGVASVSDIDAAPFSIVPNPAADHIDITGVAGTVTSMVDILDAQGRVVLRHDVANGVRIHIKQLPAGSYSVRCAAEGRVYTLPLVIMR